MWGYGKENVQIGLAEYTINHQLERILQDIYLRQPDVIGFSCYIWNISYIKALVADLKKVLPQVKIWLGGPEVSYCAEDILQEEPGADLVMKGEGEETFAQFLRFLAENEIEKPAYGGLEKKTEAAEKTGGQKGWNIYLGWYSGVRNPKAWRVKRQICRVSCYRLLHQRRCSTTRSIPVSAR